MNEQKIDKTTRHVRFLLLDGTVIEGDVFLRLFEARHSGPQRLGELLNDDDDPFIPLRCKANTVLVNRDQIMLASTTMVEELDELFLLGTCHRVCIKTLHKGTLEGEIYVNLPQGSSRAKDYFNQKLTFYTLIDAETVHYVHRSFIMTVQD